MLANVRDDNREGSQYYLLNVAASDLKILTSSYTTRELDESLIPGVFVLIFGFMLTPIAFTAGSIYLLFLFVPIILLGLWATPYRMFKRLRKSRAYNKSKNRVFDGKPPSIRLATLSRYSFTRSRPQEDLHESFALSTLLNNKQFGPALLTAMYRKVVGQNCSYEQYIDYIDSNPDDELFPNLKPLLDEYLLLMAPFDINLRELEGKATPAAIADTKKRVTDRAEKVIAAMVRIAHAHAAKCDEKAKIINESAAEIADIQLSSLIDTYDPQFTKSN